MGDAFNTLGRMKNISCPVLVAASPDDEIIPGEHGRILYGAAREPKMFLPLKGDHNWGFIYTGRAYSDGLERFFSSLFGDGKGKNEVE